LTVLVLPTLLPSTLALITNMFRDGLSRVVMFAGIAILVGTRGRQMVSEDKTEELPEPARELEAVARS
jgi:hypothetical protein